MGSKVAILVESMAELEIVPRPEVTAAISDDPHNLSDVSSEDEEEEEEFTGIELVRAVPVPDLVPAVQVPVFRLPVLVLICDISGDRFGTHLPVLICDTGPNRYNIRYYNPWQSTGNPWQGCYQWKPVESALV